MKRIVLMLLAVIPLALPMNAAADSYAEFSNIPGEIFEPETGGDPAESAREEASRKLLLQQDLLKKEIISLRENNRVWAILSVCIISVIGLIIVIFSLHKIGGKASDIVGASGLNFIVFGTIILVIVSDTDQQLTAAMGVLGAIAGYLFGTLKERRGTS